MMGERSPHLISKVRAHLSKSQAVKIGLCEEWRRGNEIVDNIARGLAERAYEDKELLEFKKTFDADVKLVKATMGRLQRTAEYKDGTRKKWKDHTAKPKALRGRRGRGTGTSRFGMLPGVLGCARNAGLSAGVRQGFANVVNRSVFEGEDFGRSLIRLTL